MSDGLVEPVNAPPGLSASVGVQPGTTAAVVRARSVIVFGPTGAPVGVFIYAAGTTPGPGNPPIVAATNQTQDPYGNSLVPADSPATAAELIVFGAGGSYAQIANNAGIAEMLLGTGDASETLPGEVFSQISGAGGTRQPQTVLASPQLSGQNPSVILVQGASQDGTVNSVIQFQCVNRTVFGLSGNAWWSDATQQLNLPAAGGPFIFGEAFHNVSLAAGLTGRCRVKKLSWNYVGFDFQVSVSNTNVAFTLGSLPDATYYPSAALRIPLGVGNNQAGHVAIPTSGALTVGLAASANGFAIGTDIEWPTN